MPNRDRLQLPKLRVGIMVNSLTVTCWVAKIVADIQNSSVAEIMLVLQNSAPQSQKKSRWERLRTYWSHGLFEYYKRWDQRRHRSETHAFEQADIREALKGIAILPIRPIQKGFVDRFSSEDIAQVKEARLDVLFRFGFRIIRGEILSCAKFGVWSFHHGDNREYRGAPPGFWEMYEGNPVTGSILQVLSDALDGGRVIYRSLSATNFESLYLTLNPLYWKTAEFALRRLKDLHRNGWAYIQALPEFNERGEYRKAIYRTPPAPVMMRFLTRLLARKVYRSARARLLETRTRWFVAYRPRSGARTALTDRSDFRIVPCPIDRFYADPFLFKKEKATFLFFEDFDFLKNRAAISCVQVDSEGCLSGPTPVLDTGYHMSYPHLFESQGAVYMIPETRSRKTIELYRAIDFPIKWELVKIIAENLNAVDATILERDGKFWLFANIGVPGASTFDELHLFSAESLEGNWTPHPKNPVVSDVRRARPAGSLFIEDGKLIRPSQDCSVRYGGALVFNEVLVLSENDYNEKPFARVEPDWCPGSICTHTYNRTEEFEVLDGMKLIRQLRPIRNWHWAPSR